MAKGTYRVTTRAGDTDRSVARYGQAVAKIKEGDSGSAKVPDHHMGIEEAGGSGIGTVEKEEEQRRGW